MVQGSNPCAGTSAFFALARPLTSWPTLIRAPALAAASSHPACEISLVATARLEDSSPRLLGPLPCSYAPPAPPGRREARSPGLQAQRMPSTIDGRHQEPVRSGLPR